MGQPVIAAAVQLFCGGMLILCFRVGWNAFWPGFIACCVMGETARAYETVNAYKRWNAAVDEAVGARPRWSFRNFARLALASATIIATVAFLGTPGSGAALLPWVIGYCVLAFPIWLFRCAIRHARRRRTRPRTVAVVARCVMRPVPLSQAGRLLPDHCRRILSKPRS